MPQCDAGERIEPPASLPIAPRQKPAATAAAEPDDDPPVERVSPHGFRAGGYRASNVGPPNANSKVSVWPRTIAPASRRSRTTVASRSGM